MIIYNNQNIHKWAFWKKKPKFLFCITSGLIFALGVTTLTLLIKLCGNESVNLLRHSFTVFAGSFVSGSLFSIILWYLNDDRYQDWQKMKDPSS